MASRTLVKRVGSEAVQGEGSFVVLRLPTRGEVLRVQEVARALVRQGEAMLARANIAGGTDEGLGKEWEALQARNQAMADKLVCSRVVEWNWVDSDGARLAVPRSAAALGELTVDEATWLEAAVMGMFRGGSEKN